MNEPFGEACLLELYALHPHKWKARAYSHKKLSNRLRVHVELSLIHWLGPNGDRRRRASLYLEGFRSILKFSKIHLAWRAVNWARLPRQIAIAKLIIILVPVKM
jgi:hypothetical protein